MLTSEPHVAAEAAGRSVNRCRHCDASLSHTVVDLRMSPLSETFPAAEELNRTEPFYPCVAESEVRAATRASRPISDRSGMSIDAIDRAAHALREHGPLTEAL